MESDNSKSDTVGELATVSNNSGESSADNYELLFLIVKYLRDGICPGAADLLESELTSSVRNLLPPRLDWQGRRHVQTFSDLESQFPNITGQHLTNITTWLSRVAASSANGGGGIKSLLSLPRHKNKSSSIPSTLNIIHNHQLGVKRTGQNYKSISTLPVYTNVYSKLQLQRRCLGHLSSVFCLLFDKSGHFVFTGADDLLVKMWGTYSGRLYFTFRGASAEISDMAVSDDNKLLAAGSTDKIIRVWCLMTAAPVAVLSKHTGTITALHFCPCAVSSVSPYLAATSGDGTVSFWKYQYKDKAKRKPLFDPEPTRYHEKMRPGGAQMICAAFSPGGLFLATGSVDHHVRVYIMEGRDGPGKVLEQEAHTERVDSIQWANSPRLRFVSGSKDGTARIWSFRSGCWNSSVLKVTASDGRTVIFNKEKKCEEQLRVTMVNWTCDDAHVITAVSDCSLCVWSGEGGQLLRRLTSHKDEVYVLEPHPSLSNILMSGAHDGNLIIWDISTASVLFKHHNVIEPQGHGAIYDAKWCPDHLNIAASDSHGHVLFFSTTSKEAVGQSYNKCPEEMFFHTDYRPLLRDAAHYVLDEQTQCAPHLLPPPFLVDVEGNPYPADIQRQVPGREHLSDKELLVPDVQVAGPLVPDVQVAGPMSPPLQRPGSSAARRSIDQPQPQPQVQQPSVSNLDALIEELAANVAVRNGAGSPHNLQSEHSYAAADREAGDRDRPPDIVRNNGPGADGGQPSLATSVWRRRQLVGSEMFRSQHLDRGKRKVRGVEEKKFYNGEKEKGRLFSGGPPAGFHEGVEVPTASSNPKQRRSNARGRAGGVARQNNTAPAAAPRQAPVRRNNDNDDDSDSDDEEDHDFNHESVTDSSLTESDLEEPSDDGDDGASTEYSDWGDNNLTPPQRTAKKSAKAVSSQPASSDDEDDMHKPGPSRYFRRKKYKFDPRKLDDIPKDYHPSAWLAESVPKKSPYFPQMGDEVMYFKQGHMGYIALVRQRKCYNLNMKEQRGLQDRSDLGSVELVKVVGMKYEIRPPRLCCLKLAVINQETNQLTGQKFSIKYHDMEDVVDFLVLRHIYESSVAVTWNEGDRYRCQIEDNWWYGTVLGVSAFDPSVPESSFLSIQCVWDSGEEERLSPWDLDIIPDDDIGHEKVDKQVPVTKEEIERHIYQPLKEEWRGLDSKAECLRIAQGLGELMALAHAENFNYPVDLTAFPDYMLEIEYPMDFSLIKSRLDNHFYRRLTAVQFDVRYIATNAECYNRPKTEIVKCARILTDLVLKIIQDPKISNISREWHKLYEAFDWADTQEPSKKNPRKPQKPPPNPKQWKHDCMELLKKMYELPDSAPFREPVNEEEFPDYNRVINTPMDLTLVRESLTIGEYESPLAMQKDVLLIFQNSFQYNTNKKSPVLRMTKKLKEYFLDEIHHVISDWRKTNRRIGCLNKKNKSPKGTPAKKTPSKRIQRKVPAAEESDDDEETEENKPEVSQQRSARRNLDLSSEDEDRPRDKGKGKGKGKSSKKSQPSPRKTRAPTPKSESEESEEEEEVSEEEDVPLARRRNQPRSRGSGPQTSQKSRKSLRDEISDESDDEVEDDEEEEIEETPEETSEEDFEEVRQKPSKKRQKQPRRSLSSEGPGPSRTVRPKRSAKAKVVRNASEESEEEEEEKIPYRRRIVPPPRRSESGDDSRPLRKATKKALRRFQDASEEEDDMAERRSPRKKAKQSRRPIETDDDDEEEENIRPPRASNRRRRQPQPESEDEEEDSAPPPPPRPQHSRRSRNVDPEPGPSPGATVTISAADSSTDHVRVGRRDHQADRDTSDPGEGGSQSVRPQRKRVKPARLQEYDDGDINLRGNQRNKDNDNDDGRNRTSRHRTGEKRKRSDSGRRASRSTRYEENSEDVESNEEAEENQVLSRRISRNGHSRRQSGGGERRKSNSDFMLSPKAKRAKAVVNYKDDASEDYEEEDYDDLPPRRTANREPKDSGRRSKRSTNYREPEESQSEEDEVDSRRSRHSGNRNSKRDQRRKKSVRYEENEESEEESDEGNNSRRERAANQVLQNLEAYAEDDNSDEDLGRRRGSRRRMVIQSPRHNFRPQRASGQTARNNYREESDDDDLVPKRHHGQRHGHHLNRARSGRGDNNEEATRARGDDNEDNTDNNQEEPGVSSRGRIRRPNPRLLD